MEIVAVQNKIYNIRNKQVMLDFDLAEMYQTETKNLNLSVKRNIKRFPLDFMFQLNNEEWDSLRLQIETSKRGGRRYLPFAFTEQGVAMLSGLLNTDTAIQVNIAIMRAFVAIRHYALGYAELKRKLEEYMVDNDMRIAEILDIITEMNTIKSKPLNPIGYTVKIEK
jgi:hypothetical protein